MIGVWASANRRKGHFRDGDRNDVVRSRSCRFPASATRCSTRSSCRWAKGRLEPRPPYRDNEFAQYVARPELAKLLPVLYPGVFPNLAAYTADRADLLAILLTGIPAGVIPGFQNFTGPKQADMLRLNMAIPPAPSPTFGHPRRRPRRLPQRAASLRRRRAVELRAVAGATLPLIDPTFVPDAAAGLSTTGPRDCDT